MEITLGFYRLSRFCWEEDKTNCIEIIHEEAKKKKMKNSMLLKVSMGSIDELVKQKRLPVWNFINNLNTVRNSKFTRNEEVHACKLSFNKNHCFSLTPFSAKKEMMKGLSKFQESGLELEAKNLN